LHKVISIQHSYRCISISVLISTRKITSNQPDPGHTIVDSSKIIENTKKNEAFL